MINKHKAFTLAEVLITLGIIGVVAAITIPTLINNAQKIQYVTALKKAYSTLSQVHEKIVADNDTLTFALTSVATSEAFANVFAEKMNITENCGAVEEAGPCFRDFKGLDNETLTVSSFGDGGAFISIDGMSYIFLLTTPYCNAPLDPIDDTDLSLPLNQTCGLVGVDINGPNKGPAIAGRDIFLLYVTQKGIYPYGTRDETLLTDCSVGSGSSANCAARVLSENAMNY